MDRAKQFDKGFAALTHRIGKGTAFADFAEVAACTVHQLPYHAGLLPKDDAFDRVEEKYLATVKRYDRQEMDQIVTLYCTATLALEECPHDFLGQAFMRLEVSNDNKGQFFTPDSVASMMAKMTMAEAGAIIAQGRPLTVSDPASGAGCMLIHAANEVRAQGFDPTQTMWVQATDIDRTCFNMAYFQLSTLGIPGEVVHGNTLSMEAWEVRATPQWKLMEGAMGPVSRPAIEAPQKPPAQPPAPKAGKGRQFEFDLDR